MTAFEARRGGGPLGTGVHLLRRRNTASGETADAWLTVLFLPVVPFGEWTIERAESVLRNLGCRVFRVRHHDALARLEIARDEMARALEPDVRARIVSELRALGYLHVTIDLQGYRMGSLNEGVRLRPA